LRIDELGLRTDFRHHHVGDVGVVANDLAVLEKLVRDIGRLGTDHQSAALLHLLQRVRPSRSDERHGEQARSAGTSENGSSKHKGTPWFCVANQMAKQHMCQRGEAP
jgi:hypothetical protein